jgi:transglutaminase-like putative cysteine protease
VNKLSFFNNMPLVLSLVVGLAVASTEIPVWASGFSLVFLIWRFLHEKFNIYKLSPKITPLFGLMFFVIVYLQHKTIFGQEESITILVGLTSITILNFETLRDLKFLVLLGFLMVVLKSVFSIDFIWVIPAVFSYFGLWLTLIFNNKVGKIKYLSRVVLRSVPVLVLLFILFPRLVLFQVQKVVDNIARSGFSEEMTPGRFTQLGLNDQMVFRAQFLNTDSINMSDLYWRGSVLNNSNGFIWTKGSTEKKSYGYNNSERADVIKYRVVQEPLSYRNIFVLDKPFKVHHASEPVVEWNHSIFTLAAPQQQLLQFDGESVLNLQYLLPDDPVDLKKYTRVSELGPRTTDWINATKEKHASLKGRYDALVDFFSKPGFIYTLQPDYYGNDLDEFLFVKKRGFCEHYAAAFGSMARALDIPARVVIGYHGGRYNELSDFWRFSQRDAHAWVEVGLDGSWRRIDPTGLVSPLRITLGSEEYFSLDEADRILFSKEINYRNVNQLRRLYLRLQQVIDSLNYNWTMLLLNYDLQAQLDILKSIKVSWFFMSFVGFIVLLLLVYFFKNRKTVVKNKHELYKLMLEIDEWAQNEKISVDGATPPLSVVSAIAKVHPEFKDFSKIFSRQYELVVYQKGKQTQNVQQLSQLKTQWRQFVAKQKKKAG